MKNTLIAVGDIALGDSFVCASFGTRSYLEKHPKHRIFEQVEKFLRKGDIVFGNLETVLSDKGLDKNDVSSMHLRGSYKYISQILDAGFNVINIANNHIMQHGIKAFEETVRLLKDNDITVVGLSVRNGKGCVPAFFSIGDRQIIFIGYSFVPEKYAKERPRYACGDESVIIEDIRKYRTYGDPIVCSLHWGEEFIGYPSEKQIRLARKMIDNGCNLILGHHSHVPQTYEKYRDSLIFYSLGNFVFDMKWNKNCQRGLIVKVIWENQFKLEWCHQVVIGDGFAPFIDDNLSTSCKKMMLNKDESESDYSRKCQLLEKYNRYKSWKFMLKNLFKYKKNILMQIIYLTLKRKALTVADHIKRGNRKT